MRRKSDSYSRGWLTFYLVDAVVALGLLLHDFGSGWAIVDAALLALWTWLALREIERMPVGEVA